jgi:glucose-6-phosphate 1-dehydrogenase
LLSPLIEKLESETYPKKFPNYEAGSTGPEAAAELLKKDGRSWRMM